MKIKQRAIINYLIFGYTFHLEKICGYKSISIKVVFLLSYYPRLNHIYITERLKRRLDEINGHPVTTIIAPMGFGKTTAIDWWAKKQAKKEKDAVILRQMIATNSITDFWTGLCKVFKKYPILAEQMKALGFPKDPRSISIFAELLQDTFDESHIPIYLIIDDLYLLGQQEVLPLILFLSRTMTEKFHIIFLSRNQIFGEDDKMRLGNLLCEITVEDLRLKEQELYAYSKYCDIQAANEEIHELSILCEGWISMIYLNFKSYVQNGTWLSKTEDIYTLINRTLLDPLPERSREFLILCGMTDEFTKNQAIYLWQNEEAIQLLESLTENNSFITKNDSGIYRYHHMLQQCTRQKFSEKPEEYRKENYSRLGHLYIKSGEYIKAYYSFYKGADWNGLFITIEKDKLKSLNTEHSKDLFKWINECPEEIILKYPSAITPTMLKMFSFHNIPELKRMKMLLLKSLEQDKILTQEEKNNLLGDAEVSESFLSYNNISSMSAYHRRANSLLSRTSLSVDPRGAWTFSAPSVFMMYHRTVGGADRENEEMKECMPYYYQISDGHGNGAEHSFLADLCYERGQITEADISNRMAMAAAKRKNQFSIMINSRILSMRMAVFKGDTEEIRNCIADCREWLLREKQYTLINTLEISQGFIYSLLEHPENSPKWFLEGRLSEALVMFPAMPMLHTYYNQLLLAKGEWTEVIARSEDCKNIYGVYNNVMCQIWLHIQLSAAFEKLKKHNEALDELKHALNMAAPDRIIMPFAESEAFVEGLLEELKEQNIYVEEINIIMSLSKEFKKGKKNIQEKFWGEYEDYGLSNRELEIAKLAALRKTNMEIAEELHLAEGTVRNQLSRIFDKLNIDGSTKNKRIKLEELLKIKKQ